MLESYRAARTRRVNGRRSRLELKQLQAELGYFASDVDLDRVDLVPPQDHSPGEQTRALRQMLALQVIPH